MISITESQRVLQPFEVECKRSPAGSLGIAAEVELAISLMKVYLEKTDGFPCGLTINSLGRGSVT